MKNIRTKQEILENHKIILIFGVPCAGKSILTYNTFIKNSKLNESKYDLMKYTSVDNYFLLGHFPLSSNRKGLDSIERKQVGNLSIQIENLLKQGKSVILEGNRCISRPMMSKLNKKDILMLWVDCGIDIALDRAHLERSIQGDKQLKIMKSTLTMCTNFTNDFLNDCDVYYIDTSDCKGREDFENKTFFDFDWVWKVTKW